MEVWTMNQLSEIDKPVALLNTAGFFAAFLGFIDHMVDTKFLPAAHRHSISVDADASALIDKLHSHARVDVPTRYSIFQVDRRDCTTIAFGIAIASSDNLFNLRLALAAFGGWLADVTQIAWFQGLAESVSLSTGAMSVACVLLFRRGIVGECAQWIERRGRMRARGLERPVQHKAVRTGLAEGQGG
jgi:hypothetical protein